MKPLRLHSLLNVIILNTQQLSEIYHFDSVYTALAVITESGGLRAPPHTVFLEWQFPKSARLSLSTQGRELSAALAIFDQCSKLCCCQCLCGISQTISVRITHGFVGKSQPMVMLWLGGNPPCLRNPPPFRDAPSCVFPQGC